MIRFTHVTKQYPRTGTAVDDVTMHVGKGEFVFFTGPSGAGKTTLLKMVYMEERPTSGEVRVSGTSSVTARDREVAKAFLRPLQGHLTKFGMGSLAEVYDAEVPQNPNGCFAQAWSVAETLRVWKSLL